MLINDNLLQATNSSKTSTRYSKTNDKSQANQMSILQFWSLVYFDHLRGMTVAVRSSVVDRSQGWEIRR